MLTSGVCPRTNARESAFNNRGVTWDAALEFHQIMVETAAPVYFGEYLGYTHFVFNKKCGSHSSDATALVKSE
jgi:hypothetical protein